MRFGIEKAQWQLLQALKQIRTDDAHRVLRHVHQQQRLPQRAQPAAQEQQEHEQHCVAQGGGGIRRGDRQAASASQRNQADGHALERKAHHALARGMALRKLIREEGGAHKGGNHANHADRPVDAIVFIQNIDDLAGDAGRDQVEHGGRHQKQHRARHFPLDLAQIFHQPEHRALRVVQLGLGREPSWAARPTGATRPRGLKSALRHVTRPPFPAAIARFRDRSRSAG